jgi:hypothetical protein
MLCRLWCQPEIFGDLKLFGAEDHVPLVTLRNRGRLTGHLVLRPMTLPAGYKTVRHAPGAPISFR